MKPPTMAPAMTSRMVTMAPPGSRPGMMAFAITPAMRPKTIQPMIESIFFSSDCQVVSHALDAVGRHGPYRFCIRPGDVFEGKQTPRRGEGCGGRRGLSGG